jgi:outer membrane lipoprotein SlyB
MKTFTAFLACVGLVALSGCAGNLGGSSYYRNEARSIQRVELGTLIAVHIVQIKGGSARGGISSGEVGTGVGAVAGGIAGNSFGSGNGRALATVGGVVLGALAGHAIGSNMGATTGVQLTVRLKNGRLIAVTQQAGHTNWRLGQEVEVLISQDGTARVQPL